MKKLGLLMTFVACTTHARSNSVRYRPQSQQRTAAQNVAASEKLRGLLSDLSTISKRIDRARVKHTETSDAYQAQRDQNREDNPLTGAHRTDGRSRRRTRSRS